MNDVTTQLKLSYGRCASSPGFFDDFYQNFFNSSPLIRVRFDKTDMKAQKELLRHGLSHLIMFAGGSRAAEIKVDRLAESHSKKNLDIQPWMYKNWMKALMVTVKKHDLKYDENVQNLWESAIEKGVQKMTSGY